MYVSCASTSSSTDTSPTAASLYANLWLCRGTWLGGSGNTWWCGPNGDDAQACNFNVTGSSKLAVDESMTFLSVARNLTAAANTTSSTTTNSTSSPNTTATCPSATPGAGYLTTSACAAQLSHRATVVGAGVGAPLSILLLSALAALWLLSSSQRKARKRESREPLHERWVRDASGPEEREGLAGTSPPQVVLGGGGFEEFKGLEEHKSPVREVERVGELGGARVSELPS